MTSYYEFIGECFVYGHMDGEALAGRSEDQLGEFKVEFNLR